MKQVYRHNSPNGTFATVSKAIESLDVPIVIGRNGDEYVFYWSNPNVCDENIIQSASNLIKGLIGLLGNK